MHTLAIHSELEEAFSVEWLNDVQREGATRGDGLNTLRIRIRTYVVCYILYFYAANYALYIHAEARLKLLHVLEWYCNDFNLVLPDNEEALFSTLMTCDDSDDAYML